GRHRDREVVEATEDLGVGTEVEPREVEEREQVAVADVEEEVRRALVVAVLEELGERELEHVLVEADRRLHVARDQREVMHAARRRLGSRVVWTQMLLAQRRPLLGPVDVGAVSGHRVSSGQRGLRASRCRRTKVWSKVPSWRRSSSMRASTAARNA